MSVFLFIWRQMDADEDGEDYLLRAWLVVTISGSKMSSQQHIVGAIEDV